MSESTLTFASTESFRNKLLAKNLAPYNIPGVYSPQVSNLTYETVLSSYSVTDSPGELIANDPFANKLYPLNEFGPEGGYNLTITFNGPLLPVDPNQGPYWPLTDSPLVDNSNFYLNLSVFSPNQMNSYRPEDGYILLYSVDDYENINKIFIPYWEPPSFIPSIYSPYEIFTSTNPTGSDGPLSQDSYMVRLAAESLRDAFQARVAYEIFQSTVGQVNLQSLQDPFNASLLITGQQPLVYQNWRITIPENPILRAADLATRLASAYWPVSPIPGDYFDENTPNGQSSQVSNALNVANQLTGGFLGPVLNITRNPSEIFLANTGNAQRSALFNNIDYNRYQPAYKQTLGGILGIAQGLVQGAINLLTPGDQSSQSGYYVGSRDAEPGQITSPPNQVPVDAYGRQVNAPVYGPSELGILFEGNETQINFGLKAKSFADSDNITGDFVWTSPKYKGAAGYHPTPGGGVGSRDNEFNVINSDYSKAESTNITFKKNSILDNTQRLVQSADNLQGIQKLKHVGNAINQVSKVFNDGYKEMTKGSQVLSYTDNTTGGEVGREYCRVFAKDTPYLTYADLQKRDGITTTGRRFTNSVLDSTYNLNIAPLRGSTEDRIGSTNLQKNAKGTVVAKKYMFSIENLAWRTSSKPGFTYDELPDCEKGPNGGRVMWFPPYDIKFSESSSANFNSQTFLGRPEPIYTYKDSSRTGSLSWKIVVDNPSILNVIVEQQLKGQNKEKINSIIDSFFAGCVKYDIYELAKKFNTIPSKDLYVYQEIINNPRLTPEELAGVQKEIPIDVPGPQVEEVTSIPTKQTVETPNPKAAEFNTKYKGFAFYFDNDIPGPQSKTVKTADSDFQSTYNSYIGRKSDYQTKSSVTFNTDDFNSKTNEFFDLIQNNYNLINDGFINDAKSLLEQEGTVITIELAGSASATASVEYNQALSERRVDSIKKYLDSKGLKESDKFIIKTSATGEQTTIPQYTNEITTGTTTESVTDSGANTQNSINCTEDIKDKTGKVTSNSQIYSVSAMACRRVRISNINCEAKPLQKEVDGEPKKEVKYVQGPSVTSATTLTEYPPRPEPTVSVIKKLKEGIGKQILRKLISECDYFEVIKETNPFVYGTIKEKIKYFNPAFHSMTPEGLNSRLTFLNQCLRPGETIPTIGADGTPIYDNARNTSFGAPPILILRIGDFFHTKIIPTSLQIGYEPLVFDMNPEGIGVQPMIATVSMSFNMIGGQGLAKPVEQLQNALSFNYYGNTEIYDERAVPTEDTSALDKTLVNETLTGELSATPNQVVNQQPNDGGTTIGTIITNIPVVSGQTGEIGYKDIMDKLYDNTKDYFNTLLNKLDTIVLQNNWGVLEMFNSITQSNTQSNTIKIKNNTTESDLKIYGDPSNFEQKVNDLFQKINNNISANPIILGFQTEYGSSYSGIVLDTLKDNLKTYLKSYQTTFSNNLATISQDLTIYEQDYVQLVKKVQLVSQALDGKLLSGNIPRVYNLSGTSDVSSTSEGDPKDTLEELRYDFNKLFITTKNFYDLCFEKSITNDVYFDGDYEAPVPMEFGGLNEKEDKYFYIVISRVLTDNSKLEEFTNALTKGLTDDNQLVRRIKRTIDDVADRYRKEQKIEEKIIKDFKKLDVTKAYLDGLDEELYVKGKLRKCNYDTTPNSSVQANGELIKDLYLNPFKFKK